jgi:hypothetical protein
MQWTNVLCKRPRYYVKGQTEGDIKGCRCEGILGGNANKNLSGRKMPQDGPSAKFSLEGTQVVMKEMSNS